MSQPGTLPDHALRQLISDGAIAAPGGVSDQLVQPASIDLTIAAEAVRMPGSTLPLPGERVRDLIEALALETVDLSQPACLGRGQVYWVRLNQTLALPGDLAGYANSKSSTGRIDLATRVLTDGSQRYDRIPAGYQGELWLELIPRSFDVVATAGDSLTQAIFFRQRQVLDHATLSARYADEPLLFEPDGSPVPAATSLVDGRVMMTADLDADIVGWVSRRTHRPLRLTGIGAHAVDDFFVPVPRPPSGYLCLEKDRFYILATRERVAVPADLACEMVPYDPSAGEFRAHYAGFFDPGWGSTCDGLRAVLEVRPHADDLILRHGQPICAMAYETLTSPCERVYGSAGNNYANQDGPRLSKHFAG